MSNQKFDQQETKSKKGKDTGLWIVFGFSGGILIGIIFGNLIMGMLLGMCLGVVIGAIVAR